MAEIRITARSDGEAAALERGLADPEVHAFVVTVGLLADLSTDARRRVLGYFDDFVRSRRTPPVPGPNRLALASDDDDATP